MKRSISNFFTLIALIAIFTSCASSYRRIEPMSVYYSAHDLKDEVSLSYKYDVLLEAGNRKYARKESGKDIKVIAVKVTNNSDSSIVIGKDATFFANGKEIFPLGPEATMRKIKQYAAGYLPYALFTFVNLHVQNGNDITTIPVGYLLGPGLTIGNMATAGSANKNLLAELHEYNIMGRVVAPKQTVYGIIGVRDLTYSSITLEMK